MKKAIIAAVIAIYFLSISAVAQVRPTLTASNHPSTTRTATPSPTPSATRARVADNGTKISQPGVSANSNSRPVNSSAGTTWGNSPLTNLTERPRVASPNVSKAPAASAITAPTTSTAPTQTYRVGIGDILDIQLPDSISTRSTLYTVTAGGFLDYPLVGAPLQIAGLTTDAIAQRLRASIKVLDNPQINVKVRDYASHTVNVIGFVSLPGSKVLRREAVPLYVVIAEAMPLGEATNVTVVRNGRDIATVNLRDQNAMNQLVVANDTLKVSGGSVSASEYFFVGGEVNAPGQKAFHSGLTLTQAIITGGGTSLNANSTVRVSRQGADGRLSTIEYNLRNIQNGKTPDPQIQKGDRIEVTRNN